MRSHWTTVGPESGVFVRERMEDLNTGTQIQKAGHVDTEAGLERCHQRPEEAWGHQDLEIARKASSRRRPCPHLDFELPASELLENTFLRCYAAWCVVLFDCNHKKLLQPSNNKYHLLLYWST
jgi:hypothetical protein